MQQYTPFELAVYGIILLNVVISMMAFNNIRMFEKLKFNVGSILQNKEYSRIISSAFLHGGWMHLLLNMYVFYIFSHSLASSIAVGQLLIIYFVSLLIGNLLPLFMHRNDYNYSAVGASGAVSGILYASIYFTPENGIGIFPIPFYIPGWIFGILYLAYTIYGIKKNNDNIGHDAHFGGAVMGLIIAILIQPQNLEENYLKMLAMLVPVVYFFTTMVDYKEVLPTFTKKDTDNFNYSKRSIDDLYNYSHKNKEIELNKLLEKVNKNGVESLTKYEKERLDDLSQELK